MRALRWMLAAALAAVVVLRLELARRAPPAPPAAGAQDLGAAPDFSLIDQHGKRVTRAELDGKPWLASFIFTRCQGQCPMMVERMARLRPRMPGVRMISFSVDPRDSPRDLRRFAARHGADWTFLSGRGDAVRRVSLKGFHLAAQGGGAAPIIHSDQLVLVDRAGRIRGYFDPADDADVAKLVSLSARP